MIRTLATGLIAASTLLLAGAPADAQDRYYETWRGQRDVPGDFRCDAFWDRGRTDCDAAWRDQRSWSQRRHDGYSGYDHGRRWNRAHYGRQNRHGYGYGDGHDRWRQGGGVTAYYGAYGRPDLVTGESYGYASGRDPRRVDWCRWNYRSYDPRSGYYRAYSGRLIFCG